MSKSRAEEKYRMGDLPGALETLQDEIRKAPDHAPYRIFYFQLLSLLGQWDRALNQLSVLEKMDRDAWPLAQTYRSAIQCEILRAEVFAGLQTPLIFGEPPAWIALLVEALRLLSQGQHDQATALRNQAFDSVNGSHGNMDGQPFEWIADADSRLGPVCELILNGRYYWAPFEQIRSISIPQPQDIRDLVWLPVEFAWTNGGKAVGFIPTRYPGTENTGDAALQLARSTQWQEVADGITQGLGQRMLATDQDDYPIMDVRLVSIG